jgi:group I intron endonuclease
MKFPIVMEFKDLNLIDSLESAKKALKGLSGIYCIKCIVTGTIYIGSSINMAKRLVDHVVDKDTNVHLQNAINNYGLENFVFVVVEFYEVNPSVSLETNKANLLALEQKHLDWLFSLPESLRYNFLSTAGSSLGYTPTLETLA